MNKYQYLVVKTVDAASAYWKKKMYPTFKSCLSAAVSSTGVRWEDADKESWRRYNLVKNSNQNRNQAATT